MVDALRATIRVLRPRGLLIDLRPFPGREPRVLSRGHVVGELVTWPDAAGDDAASDVAVQKLVDQGALRQLERAGVWYQKTFADLPSLVDYLDGSIRFESLPDDTRRALAPRAAEPVTVRRSLMYQVLARA